MKFPAGSDIQAGDAVFLREDVIAFTPAQIQAMHDIGYAAVLPQALFNIRPIPGSWATNKYSGLHDSAYYQRPRTLYVA